MSKNTNIHCLLDDKKSAKKVQSKDLVYEKSFQLSSRTPQLIHYFSIVV